MADSATPRESPFGRNENVELRNSSSGRRPSHRLHRGLREFRERDPSQWQASDFAQTGNPVKRQRNRYSQGNRSYRKDPSFSNRQPQLNHGGLRESSYDNNLQGDKKPRSRSNSPEFAVIAVRGHAGGKDWDITKQPSGSRPNSHDANVDIDDVPACREGRKSHTRPYFSGVCEDFPSHFENREYVRRQNQMRSHYLNAIPALGRGRRHVQGEGRSRVDQRDRRLAKSRFHEQNALFVDELGLPSEQHVALAGMSSSTKGVLKSSPEGGPGIEWMCTNCKQSNFARREKCRACGAMRNVVTPSSMASEALKAAQWCSASGIVPQPSNFVTDEATGWKFDPVTRYYVIDEDDLIFYDGVGVRYVKFELETRAYVPCAPPSGPDAAAEINEDDAYKKEEKFEGKGNEVDPKKTNMELEGTSGLLGVESEVHCDIVAPTSLQRARGVQKHTSQNGVSFVDKQKEPDRAIELAVRMGFLVCHTCRVYFKRQRGLERHLAESSLHRAKFANAATESS